MRISDWSSDVCSSDLTVADRGPVGLTGDRLVGGEQGEDRLEALLHHPALLHRIDAHDVSVGGPGAGAQIGRASCRGRGCQYVYISVVAVYLKKKKTKTETTRSTQLRTKK